MTHRLGVHPAISFTPRELRAVNITNDGSWPRDLPAPAVVNVRAGYELY